MIEKNWKSLINTDIIEIKNHDNNTLLSALPIVTPKPLSNGSTFTVAENGLLSLLLISIMSVLIRLFQFFSITIKTPLN